MNIHEQGKQVVARREGFRDWDDLFEWHNDNRSGELKELKEQAALEARNIIYKEFKEKFPDASDEVFDFFNPYIFVTFN